MIDWPHDALLQKYQCIVGAKGQLSADACSAERERERERERDFALLSVRMLCTRGRGGYCSQFCVLASPHLTSSHPHVTS